MANKKSSSTSTQKSQKEQKVQKSQKQSFADSRTGTETLSPDEVEQIPPTATTTPTNIPTEPTEPTEPTIPTNIPTAPTTPTTQTLPTIQDPFDRSAPHRWRNSTSPITMQNEIDVADPDEKKALIRKTLCEIMEYYDATPVKSDAEGQQRISDYFIRCATRGIKPLWEELALALGVTRASLWDWETGRYAGPLSPYTIKRAREIMASFDGKLAIEGKINPVVYFFRSKNYYGMRDQQDVVVSAAPTESSTDTLLDEVLSLPDGDAE